LRNRTQEPISDWRRARELKYLEKISMVEFLTLEKLLIEHAVKRVRESTDLQKF